MKNITVMQAAELLNNDKALLIDVREKEEFDAEHINKAKLFPLSVFARDVMNIPAEDKYIIFQCKLGGRSAKACEIYTSIFGDGNIYNMEGGIEAWKNAGFKTESGADK
jgi:rhodanese-related sulfurtransferase